MKIYIDWERLSSYLSRKIAKAEKDNNKSQMKFWHKVYGMMQEFADIEQESKTVIYSGDGYADGHIVYDMAECPNCGYEYEDGDKDWGENFCPHCGQQLNWESEG